MSVSVDNLANAILEELENYNQDVTDSLKVEVKKVSKECLSDIKNNSPKNTGDYKKGWRLKTAYEDYGDIRIIVHNKTDYQLTHLLEAGHAKSSGGRVEGIPHIQPAEEKAAEKLMKKVKVIVKG